MVRENLWKIYDEKHLEELERVNKQYRECPDAGKTERECVRETIRLAKEAGYRDMKELRKNKESVKAGDKVYMDYMGRAIILF